ncbi:MAG: orotidine-5'-phosphate decarboxylase [Deltaproteobacteria bacterium]|nr:orotidine-5'-phosphate decarboxylase [Deltaproteobacteria bacterium]
MENPKIYSGKKKLPHDYLVFPLDVPDVKEARRLVTALKDDVGIFKVGLELFVAAGTEVIKIVTDVGPEKLFLDLKFHDIPATVKGAVASAASWGATFVTVHCGGGLSMLQAAAAAANQVKVLGVTVLTSLDNHDLRDLGLRDELTDPASLVIHRARLAIKAGCAGVVCSGREVAGVRQEAGPNFITMVPGIRPGWEGGSSDDQKRIVTPAMAVRDGADYLVVGRPIRSAADPADAAKRIAEEIATALI